MSGHYQIQHHGTTQKAATKVVETAIIMNAKLMLVIIADEGHHKIARHRSKVRITSCMPGTSPVTTAMKSLPKGQHDCDTKWKTQATKDSEMQTLYKGKLNEGTYYC